MEAAFRPKLPRGWAAEWHEGYQEWYYINISTGRSQWEEPVLAVELTRASTLSGTRINPPSNVPEGWEAAWDPKFEAWFYANIHTAKTQWEKPTQPAFAPQNKLQSHPMPNKVPLKSVPLHLPSWVFGKEIAPQTATAKLDKTEVDNPENETEHEVSNQTPAVRTKERWNRQHKLIDGLQKLHEVKGDSANASTEPVTEEVLPSFVAMIEETLRRPDMRAQLPDGETSIRKKPYQQLDFDHGFRILELNPGSRHEPLSGTLLQPLRLGKNVAYEALSYRWSDIDVDDPALIQIGDTSFPIGPNLHAALTQLRQQDVPRWIWIDQICIDQSHEVEKIQQLKIMAKIYSEARTVLIWLGEANHQSDIAMEFFPFFVDQIRRDDMMATSDNSTKVPPNIIESGGSLATALNHLFERSWFGRVWTLQEVALATRAEIWCGRKTLDFQIMETFAKGCENDKNGHWLTALDRIRPALGSSDPENPPRPHNSHIHVINKLKGGTTGTASILNALRDFDCSRDEDRIYSVLHFLDAGFVDEIPSDRKLSVTELYHYAAMYGIYRGELDHLGAAGLSQHCGSYPARQRSSNEPFLSLPSWVPDWTYRTRTHSYWVHSREHEARNGTPLFFAGGPAVYTHEWQFSEDRSILSATGIVIDEVEDCTPPFHVVQLQEGFAEGSLDFRVSAVEQAQNEFQSYIVSCMNLASRCISKYGSTNVELACRQSLVGGMMPERSPTTKGAIERATDETVNSLFERFDSMIWIWNETRSLAALGQTLLTAGNFNVTDDIMARHARLASAKERLGESPEDHNLQAAMADACKGRRFFVTSRHHYMGMAPDITEPGNKICVLNGCCAPFVIRPKGNAYQLVGECFVAGIMDGEFMESKGHLSEIILLE